MVRRVEIVSQLSDLGIAAAGFVAAGWAYVKWVRRPKFICGIPPSIQERAHDDKRILRRRLGRDSVATAFRHEPHCFAQRFPKPHRERLTEELERRLLADRERTRFVFTDEAGRASVPILIANSGKRFADYSATITFYADHGRAHVTDVVTETAPAYVYADEPDLVAVSDRLRFADARIVAAYNDYMMDDEMNRWGDVVVLSDCHLEASLYELVVVDVKVDGDLDAFFVVFSVDCTDGWTGAQTFIQGCVVNPDGVTGARAEAS